MRRTEKYETINSLPLLFLCKIFYTLMLSLLNLLTIADTQHKCRGIGLDPTWITTSLAESTRNQHILDILPALAAFASMI